MKVVLALSGGLDSAVLLAHLLEGGNEVLSAPTFDYGSKHGNWEQIAACTLRLHYKVLGDVIDVRNVYRPVISKSTLLKGGPPVPEGHYREETMRQTVVPGRNLIFLAVLAAYAEATGAKAVCIATHSGDHHIYPDCRPEFLYGVDHAIQQSTDKKVCLHAPFMSMDKAWVVRRGHGLMVPFQHTRTCYKDSQIACGKCGSCVERRLAFQLNQLTDPIQYQDNSPLPEGPKD